MKNEIGYISVLAFALLGMWVFLTGLFRGGVIRSPEGIMIVGIEIMLFAFILFVGYLVIFEEIEKKRKEKDKK